MSLGFNIKSNSDREMKGLFAVFIGLFLIFNPILIQAEEIQLISQIESSEEPEILEQIAETPENIQMTQKEIDELLGEDPYLGQTSWLGGKIED